MMDIKVFLLLLAYTTSALALSCKDEKGKDVDWYIVYKLPRESDAKVQASLSGRSGFDYAYITSNDFKDGQWKLSSKTVKDSGSIFAKTLEAVYADPSKYTYALWNDAPPTDKDNGYKAHSKGALVMDKSKGFWLIHSVPNFVANFANSYEYPETGRDNGQTAICISFNTQSEGPKIGEHLLLMRPNVYDNNLVAGAPSSNEAFINLFDKKYRHPKSEAKNSQTPLKSVDGTEFIAFSKSPKDKVDLYGAIVSPGLGTPMYVETWRRGAGGILESDCTLSDVVNNVKGLKIDFKDGSSTGDWEFVSDHSKWAISSDPKNAWTCVGDVNRMKSQAKRGGGTLCLNNKYVWQAFRSAIKTIEPCSADANGESHSKAVEDTQAI